MKETVSRQKCSLTLTDGTTESPISATSLKSSMMSFSSPEATSGVPNVAGI